MREHTRDIRLRKEENVVMTNKQAEPEGGKPPSKRREIWPEPTLFDEQLAVLLADKWIRAAIARAIEAAANSTWEAFLPVPKKRPALSAFVAEPTQNASMAAPVSFTAAKATDTRSASVPLQSTTSLSRTSKASPRCHLWRMSQLL